MCASKISVITLVQKLLVKNDLRSQFHQHSTSSFHVRRSLKYKKDRKVVSLFAHLDLHA